MATLRETKDRIASVRSTLKITSAMKLVASSKLRKAQNAIEALRPYEAELQKILQASMSAASRRQESAPDIVSRLLGLQDESSERGEESCSRPIVAVVAISSNTSLCGGFNANVIRQVTALLPELGETEVFSLGRKMADAMKKAGYESPANYNGLVDHTSYADVQGLAERLVKAYLDGRYSKVILVHNHFVSTSRQTVVAQTYLPFEVSATASGALSADSGYYLMEPDADTIVQTLLPKVVTLKLYAALLDSIAAEHAARTVAMQVATDNGEELLEQLTLEYNKERQRKITGEILELEGGSQ